jgi:PHD/YefM family antitoxin component YafN of YafNO toxin-antitoxin module
MSITLSTHNLNPEFLRSYSTLLETHLKDQDSITLQIAPQDWIDLYYCLVQGWSVPINRLHALTQTALYLGIKDPYKQKFFDLLEKEGIICSPSFELLMSYLQGNPRCLVMITRDNLVILREREEALAYVDIQTWQRYQTREEVRIGLTSSTYRKMQNKKEHLEIEVSA